VKMHSHVIVPVATVLGAVLLCACGAPNPTEPGLIQGEAGVRAVVSTFSAALVDGEGAWACSLMDAEGQRLLIGDTGAGDCPAAVLAWGVSHPGAVAVSKEELLVRVNGDTATATLPEGSDLSPLSRSGVVSVGKDSSRWIIVPPR